MRNSTLNIFNPTLHLLKFLLIILFIITEWSCKKGENDPFLSLRSRKSRISGEWIVNSGLGVKGDTNWTYDGINMKMIVDTIELPYLPQSIQYSFNKEGSYTISTITDYPKNWLGNINPAFTLNEVTEGIWNFTGGAGNTKSKSQLLLQDTLKTLSTTSYNETTTLFDGQPNGFIYDIDKLKNDEMILKYEFTNKYSGGTYRESAEWILNKE